MHPLISLHPDLAEVNRAIREAQHPLTPQQARLLSAAVQHVIDQAHATVAAGRSLRLESMPILQIEARIDAGLRRLVGGPNRPALR
jgi:hypothetical protein